MSVAPSPTQNALAPLNPQQRLDKAHAIRVKVSEQRKAIGLRAHVANGDDQTYADANYCASFTKGLPHHEADDTTHTPPQYYAGEVVKEAYEALLAALQSGDPADFSAVPQGVQAMQPAAASQSESRFGSSTTDVGSIRHNGAAAAVATEVKRGFVNPQAGLAYDLQGFDPQQCTIAAAPSFAGAKAAGEMLELYWMALARDVPFALYGQETITQAAIADLNNFVQANPGDFDWPVNQSGEVDGQTLFRGNDTPGERVGPYISQFMWLDVPFGAQIINQRIHTTVPGQNYMTTWAEWLRIQRGVKPAPEEIEMSQDKQPLLRYIRNGRDLGQYVHVDVLFQAYFNAMLLILQQSHGSNNYTGLHAAFDLGNPYPLDGNQEGFVTFGGPHIASLLCEVATRALKAVWFQKWNVHRRLRPEVYAARVESIRRAEQLKAEQLKSRYPIHDSLFQSAVLAQVAASNPDENYLLPMAFPEGSPLHPAYGAGHATVAGACITILKAFFNEDQKLSALQDGKFKPKMSNGDGTALLDYPDSADELTVGGELNKLAANIGIGRNHAGVHWRTDHIASIRLGEEIAVSLLEDHACTFNEAGFEFSFTPFGRTKDGDVPPKKVITRHSECPALP
jgi:hypothetical protein